MKEILLAIFITVCLSLVAFAAAGPGVYFKAPLPSARNSTMGANMQLELQREAIEEMRTAIAKTANFAGYSAKSGYTLFRYSGNAGRGSVR